MALAGSDTKAFWDLMTAYFGSSAKTSKEDNPWEFINGAPAIPPPLPLTDTDSKEEGASTRSAPAGASAAGLKEVKSRPLLPTKNDLLPDLCSLKDATCVYPLHEDTVNETGVSEEFQVKYEQWTTLSGALVYVCIHPKCQTPPFYSQSPAGLYSHVRRKHLRIALACPYCNSKTYWNTKGWKRHMEQHHAGAPAYGHTLVDEAVVARAVLQEMAKESGSKTTSHPRRAASATSTQAHAETEDPSDLDINLDYDPSKKEEFTEDSSSDSSSSTSSSSTDKGPSRPRPHWELTDLEMKCVMEGATALRADPTPEALKKYPSAWKMPRSSVIAHHDHPPGWGALHHRGNDCICNCPGCLRHSTGRIQTAPSGGCPCRHAIPD